MTTDDTTDGGERRILVVDDERHVCTFLQRLLQRLPEPPPVRIETAPSAEEAMRLMESEDYNLIISDYNMGGQDGICLLQHARTHCPTTLRILMTGYTDEQIQRDAHEKADVNAFVRKPLRIQELLTLVDGLFTEPRAS